MTTSLIPLIDLPFLSSEINDAHKQVTFHARSMLIEAKRAGDALIAAKKLVKHGEFKAWVVAHCRCSYRTAAKYMAVAARKDADLGTFDGGVDAFLEAHSRPRKVTAEPSREFTHENAEFALKLHAMATRGTGQEQDTAISMLDTFAKQFGMAGDEVVTKAHALIPDADKSTEQRAMDAAKEQLGEAKEELAALKAQLQQMMNRTAEIKAELASYSREELIDMLAYDRFQLEQMR